jgi:hypothetical protein
MGPSIWMIQTEYQFDPYPATWLAHRSSGGGQ